MLYQSVAGTLPTPAHPLACVLPTPTCTFVIIYAPLPCYAPTAAKAAQTGGAHAGGVQPGVCVGMDGRM